MKDGYFQVFMLLVFLGMDLLFSRNEEQLRRGVLVSMFVTLISLLISWAAR